MNTPNCPRCNMPRYKHKLSGLMDCGNDCKDKGLLTPEHKDMAFFIKANRFYSRLDASNPSTMESNTSKPLN